MPWHDQFSWKKIRDYGRLWKNRGCSPVESKPQEEREREGCWKRRVKAHQYFLSSIVQLSRRYFSAYISMVFTKMATHLAISKSTTSK